MCLILFVYMSGLMFASPRICLCWFECLKWLSFSVCLSDSICWHFRVDVCKPKNLSLLVWMSKVSVFLCLGVWFYLFASLRICLCWFECLKFLSISVCVSDSICLHVWVGVYKSKYLFLLVWMSKVSVFLCLCVLFCLFAYLGWCLQVQVFVFVGLNV
jgi:hypothetical protein